MRYAAFVCLCLLICTTLLQAQSIVRDVVAVPKVDPAALTMDGKMDEPAWAGAAQANLVTSAGFELWANKYNREDLVEPEYDELYGRMLWSDDTLFVFIHIDEFVNDSTNLYWGGFAESPTDTFGHWRGDQLYIGISNRLGVESWGGWDGNPSSAPDGPYHLMVQKDRVTFNDGYPAEDGIVYGTEFIRSGVFIDTLTGVWDVEMAIYNPNVRAQASIGFDIGGSFGSTKAAEQFGDAYGYYIWLPSVPNDPWAAATTEQWNTYWIQQNSVYWPLLVMKDVGTSVREERGDPEAIPSSYTLRQNYPNPFNPTTMISYALPHAGHVTLSVYNVLGQTVGTLVDGQRAAGTHTLSWSADNLSSGVYIYELTVDGKVVAAKKMMLVR